MLNTLKDYILKNDVNRIDEGGAGGHMKHPIDLPSVVDGNSLLRFFNNLTIALEREDERPVVKIDGINVSVRLNDSNEFVMDRMSMKELDVVGIRKSDLTNRFGVGHGMIKAGGVVLDIFNKSLNSIKPDLEKLGVFGDPTKMFNIEYVEGTTNIIESSKKFLAIHGILQIEQVTPRRRATHEISYNKSALDSMVKKLNNVASKYGFEVCTQIPATIDHKPDYDSIMRKKISINGIGEKTLKEWCDEYTGSFDKSGMVKTVSGKKVGYLSKHVLTYIMNGGNIHDEFICDDTTLSNIVKGFILYYTCYVLGAELLRCINSDIGRGDKQEGIVIRNQSLTGVNEPCKITGEFIIRGMGSGFKR